MKRRNIVVHVHLDGGSGRILSCEEATDYLGLDPRSVGIRPLRRAAGSLQFDRRDLDAYIDAEKSASCDHETDDALIARLVAQASVK